jgi:hypothetical protein
MKKGSEWSAQQRRKFKGTMKERYPEGITWGWSTLWNNPELRKKFFTPEHRKHLSEKAIKRVVDTGQIFEIAGGRGTYVQHQDHFHRSIAEMKQCSGLQLLYDSGMLHPNVKVGTLELDWVLGSNRKDPKTWLKVIEYHPVRSWEGETEASYVASRFLKLRSLGVTCPLEVVF